MWIDAGPASLAERCGRAAFEVERQRYPGVWPTIGSWLRHVKGSPVTDRALLCRSRMITEERCSPGFAMPCVRPAMRPVCTEGVQFAEHLDLSASQVPR